MVGCDRLRDDVHSCVYIWDRERNLSLLRKVRSTESQDNGQCNHRHLSTRVETETRSSTEKVNQWQDNKGSQSTMIERKNSYGFRESLHVYCVTSAFHAISLTYYSQRERERERKEISLFFLPAWWCKTLSNWRFSDSFLFLLVLKGKFLGGLTVG